MLTLILVFTFVFFAVCDICALLARTDYDRRLSDEAQEQFIAGRTQRNHP